MLFALILHTTLLMPHLASVWPILTHPLGACKAAGSASQVAACKSYNLWSGSVSDIGEITLVGGAIALLKHANCDAPRCLRYGPHRTADGHHKLCRQHHPDLPSHRLSLKEIHERHRKAKDERTPVSLSAQRRRP
jgi:hypothetical protein